ncbi:MAG: YabP/YqfC family sporulation protein [Clostridia bacterium]|nr:YabP/YqfC family sporulation protein [Clostridia bacterium]
MPKFKFKSARKNKFNFFKDNDEILSNEIIGVHTEIFSNKKIVIEGCKSIVEYQENYIKLKFKKGFFNILGTDFLITGFDDEKIVIKGNITSVEFCF